ncbi:MAG: efflux RND transporter periplasmic adaptor subunit [Candidatus Wallbacteria bacterium]
MKFIANFFKYLVVIAFFAFAIIALNFAQKVKAAPSKKNANAVQVMAIKAMPVIKGTVENIVEINGRLFSKIEATISSEVDGVLETSNYDLGDWVNTGEVLAKIKDIEYDLKYKQAVFEYEQILTKLSLSKEYLETSAIKIENISAVKKARATYENTKANLWRLSELRKNDLTSKQAIDDLESKLKGAEADLQYALEDAKNLVLSLQSKKNAADLALKKLNDTKILAPFSGYVQKKIASKGEYVKTGTSVYTLVKTDPIKFIGSVPENYITDVTIGKTAEINVDSAKAKFIGRVTKISPSSNAENHSVDIEVETDNPKYLLKPGYYANAKIVLNVNPEALMVPMEALSILAGVQKVFIIENGKAYERIVKTGRQFLDKIEITSGLTGNETVAVSNVTTLYDTADVKIENNDNQSSEVKNKGDNK